MRHVPLTDPPAPHEAHGRLAGGHGTTFILESRAGPERLARHSIVGFDPSGVVRFQDGALTITGDLPEPHDGEAPLDYLRRVQRQRTESDRSLPFVGGFVGSIGYGFASHLEPTLPRTSGDAPDMLLGFYDDAIVYDHQDGSCHYVHRGKDRLKDIQDAFARERSPAPLRIETIGSSADDATFRAQVDQAKDLIRQGECFQIVLSRSLQADYEGPLTRFYDWLRDAAQVPYLYHLRFDAGTPDSSELLGASPEMLVRVRDRQCETFPIAGTRPLTGDGRTDQRAAEDLLADRKENAEHAMLVDLARNDLSRVCRPGSVQVPTFRRIEGFRHVQHMVSHVTGELADGRDALNALAAVFPAGTVSGAPKLRAMEHIHRIEGRPRGDYAGAVAYLSLNGDLDTAITIRSLSARDGRITIQAGAGIVNASDPQSEADETMHKAATLLEGVRLFQTAEVPA